MIIKANGRDLTKEFENSNYTLLTTNISIRWDNGKISALFLKPCKLSFLQYKINNKTFYLILIFHVWFYFSNNFILVITVRISLEKNMLLSETLVNKKYKGLTSGLMGNFDGRDSNEFILPNGTVLDENATKTERAIFYNFGQHCKLLSHFQ